MTLKKCFKALSKEAGGGHITAFLSWGFFCCYGFLAITRLNIDTDINFYGIGSDEILWICAGLGLLISFLEFFYLLQPKKLDFYYSLPTNKSIIFWSRYMHGSIHVIVPLTIMFTICGLYQGMTDSIFSPYSASYTGKSILIFGAIFLIFYHIGILVIVVSGNVISAALGYITITFYGHILIANVLLIFAENFFYTYYRIPLLEELSVVLDPISLSEKLAGSGMYNKYEIFNYIPCGLYIAAAVSWSIILLFLSAIAQKKRKIERLGKVFTLSVAERTVEVFLSILAGLWAGSFFADISGLADDNRMLLGVITIFIGITAVLVVQYLLQLAVNQNKKKLLSHRWQVIIQCGAVIFISGAFAVGSTVFDQFFPADKEDIRIGISIDGLNMSNNEYASIFQDNDRYVTERQLKEYVLSEEGKTAVLAWMPSVIQKQSLGSSRNKEGVYTHAVICYNFENGNKQYRKYSIDEKDLQAFASVFETEEYKSIAYPEISGDRVLDAKFIWSDGISDTVLKISENDKKDIIEAFSEDVKNLTVEKLIETLPLGFIDINSEMGRTFQIVVYPFFEQTCSLLEGYDVPINKTLSDYEVVSLEVKDVNSNYMDGFGNSYTKFYDSPEEIEQWKQKLIPVRLDLQPLLFPLNYSQKSKAEVKDNETSSTMKVSCYSHE